MEQDLIKTLLQKAASPDCSVNIRKAVYEELSKHMNERPYVNNVCKEVYFQTAKNKPEKLLNLFPLFASVSLETKDLAIQCSPT